MRISAAVFAAAVLVAPAAEGGSDRWAPSAADATWGVVTALQRFPLFDAVRPDFAAAAADPHAVVRAAAALAIARGGEVRDLPVLERLLDDPVPPVRRLALEALLEIDSDAIREPLFRALLGDIPSSPFPSGRGLDGLLERAGLPGGLALVDAPTRREFLAGLEVAAWTTAFMENRAETDAAVGPLPVCSLEESEIDAGSRLALAVQFRRPEEGSWLQPGGPQFDWSGLDEAALTPAGDDRRRGNNPAGNDDPFADFRLSNPGEEVCRVTSPAAVGWLGRELPPGVYLLRPFPGAPPLFVRVRRSARFESGVPELLGRLDDPASVTALGEGRVSAALSPLAGRFRSDGCLAGGELRAGWASALSAIGGREAAAALLDCPFDPARPALRSTERLVSAIGADSSPELERRILSWRTEAERAPAGLAIALRLLPVPAALPVEEAAAALAEAVAGGPGRSPKGPVDLAGAAIGRVAVLEPDVARDLVLRSRPDDDALLQLIWRIRQRPLPEIREALEEIRTALDPARPGERKLRNELARVLVREPPMPPTDAVLGSKKVGWFRVEESLLPLGCCDWQRASFRFGRVFFVDRLRRLRTLDPRNHRLETWTSLPARARGIVPISANRVFVAFAGGSIAVYERGSRAPSWRRAFAVNASAHASAAADLVAIADAEGSLHAIDVATGRTKWTRAVEPAAANRREDRLWPFRSGFLDRDFLLQHPGTGLVEMLDGRTGRTRWQWYLRNGIAAKAFTPTAVVLATPGTEVVALARKTGRPLFERHVPPGREGWQPLGLSVSSDARRIFLLTDGAVHALAPKDGRELWSWTWSPQGEAAAPGASIRIAARAERTLAVVGWAPRNGSPGDGRTDLVELDGKGRELRRVTTEGLLLMNDAPDPELAGETTTIHRVTPQQTWETWTATD